MRRKYTAVVSMIILAGTLAGCWLPDNYDLDMKVAPSGSYAATFSGDIVYLPLYADIKQARAKPADIAKADKEMLTDIRKTAGVRSADARGDAAYRVVIDAAGTVHKGDTARSPFGDIGPLAIIPQGDKIIITNNANADPAQMRKVLADLRSAGLKSRGDVCIHTDAQVLESNADSKPGLLSSCYKWHVDDFVRTPKSIRMVIKATW